MKKVLPALCATLALIFSAATSQAQSDFPSRAIRIIVPYPPGGNVDVFVRAIAKTLTEQKKYTIVVDNRPGGNTGIAANACKSAEPDGHTMCLLSASTVLLNPLLHRRITYNPDQDFVPISNMAYADNVFVVQSSLQVKSLKELVQYAVKNPGKLNYGSIGIGQQGHLILEWLQKQTGAKFAHVPYPGTAPAAVALQANEIQILFIPPGSVAAQIKSGHAQPLFVDSPERLTALPEVPTYMELGNEPIKLRSWFGMFAPKGTPRALVDRLSSELSAVVKLPEFQKSYMNAIGFAPIGNTSDQFAAQIAEEKKQAKELVDISGVKLDD